MTKELEEFWLKIIRVFLIMGNCGDWVLRSPEECGMWRTTHKNKKHWLDPIGSLPKPILGLWDWFSRETMAALHDIALKVRNMTPVSPNLFSSYTMNCWLINASKPILNQFIFQLVLTNSICFPICFGWLRGIFVWRQSLAYRSLRSPCLWFSPLPSLQGCQSLFLNRGKSFQLSFSYQSCAPTASRF